MIAIALSGGVDSSVSAYLLKRSCFRLIALFMRLGNPSEAGAERHARAVARRLGIPFYPLDLAAGFRDRVVRYFLDAYARGETPNPCAVCNPAIKFGLLLERARALGAGRLATGHYVRLRTGRGGEELWRGLSHDKDQSYFLAGIPRERLGRIVFPVGGMDKAAVRRLAVRAGLPAAKSESQDICFLAGEAGAEEHNYFLRRHLRLDPGPIIGLDGRRLGTHQGLSLYTIGQRRGIEIGGTGPYYAAAFDVPGNTLAVADRADHPALYASRFSVREMNWLIEKPAAPLAAEVVIRYRHPALKAKISRLSDGRYAFELERPVRAVTPGQMAAVYRGERLIGGGFIANIG